MTMTEMLHRDGDGTEPDPLFECPTSPANGSRGSDLSHNQESSIFDDAQLRMRMPRSRSFPVMSLLVMAAVALMALTTTTSAFAPTVRQHTKNVPLKMAVAMDMPPAVVLNPSSTSTAHMLLTSSPSTSLQDGVQSYVSAQQSDSSSSSILLSLQERKPPTEEEIAQKKLTFNLIFWGGGIVAPFLATIFYFGFKFWEK